MARIRVGNDELEFVRKSDNILELEDGQANPASIFVDENGKIKFKDRDSTSTFMSTLASLGGNSKLMDAALGPPSNALPPETIVYIDLNDMRLYKRSESGWGTGFGIRGDEGSSGERGKTILYGELNPNSAAMKPQLESALIGDMYTEVGTEAIPVHQMWVKKQAGVDQVQWERLGNQYGRLGVDGAQGVRGKTIFEGLEDPRDITQSSVDVPEGFFSAVDGDVYIETDTHKIFKRKNGQWEQRGSSFKGADGAPGQKRNTIYKGTKNPNDSSMQSYLLDSIVGDVYIETDSHIMWKKQYSTASLAHPNLWVADGGSFKGADGANGLKGKTIFQGTNPTANPNDFAAGDTSAPSGFFSAEVDDIYIDTKDYQNWKFVGMAGINGPWTKVGKSYRPNGAIQGLIDPNLFEAMATSEDATSNFFMYQDEYNQADSNFDFIGDWFAVKEAKVGDTFIDTNDHLTYIKKRKENEMVDGVLKKIWETKGRKFRTNAAIQGRIDPNLFEAMGEAPVNNLIYPDKADDWKAVREAKVGDTYIDTDDHMTYIKKTATKITSPGVWVLKGKKFRPSGAIQGLVNPNVFEQMGLLGPSLTSINLHLYMPPYSNIQEAIDDWKAIREAKVGDTFIDTDDHRTYVKKYPTTDQFPTVDRWVAKGRQFRGTTGAIGPNGPKGKGHIYGSGSPAVMMSTYGSNRSGWVTWAVSEYGPTKGGDLNEEEAGEDWDEVKAAENGDKYTDSETGSTFTKMGEMWISRTKNLFKNLPIKGSNGRLEIRNSSGQRVPVGGDDVGVGDTFLKGKFGISDFSEVKNVNVTATGLGVGSFVNQSPAGIRGEITIDANGTIQGIGAGAGTAISNEKIASIFCAALATESGEVSIGESITLNLSDIHNANGTAVSALSSTNFGINVTGYYNIEISSYVKFYNSDISSSNTGYSSVEVIRKRSTNTAVLFSVSSSKLISAAASGTRRSQSTDVESASKKIRLNSGDEIYFVFKNTGSNSEVKAQILAFDEGTATVYYGDTVMTITALTNR